MPNVKRFTVQPANVQMFNSKCSDVQMLNSEFSDVQPASRLAAGHLVSRLALARREQSPGYYRKNCCQYHCHHHLFIIVSIIPIKVDLRVWCFKDS